MYYGFCYNLLSLAGYYLQNNRFNESNYYLDKTESVLNKYSQENLSHSDLLDSVGFEITAIDTIAAHSNLPLPQLLAKLLEYELRGKVAAVSGGYIKLRGDNYV